MYAAFTCKIGGPPLLREVVMSDDRVAALQRRLFGSRGHYGYSGMLRRWRGDADGVDTIDAGLEEISDEEDFNRALEDIYREATAAGAPCYIHGIYEEDCERWAFDIRKDGKIHEFHLAWLQELPTEELEAIAEFHEKWKKEHPNELA